ncbi:hypothetical protein M011DRAFT_393556 [Sporormia fimetaria CBS 119925]|uniref:DUF1989 domain-containing protein n=1 Tax=Sporormia fimetaria CBS 119925 TaxID=1340428 RepID=A0A6A6VP41_9PLEO|nr:hypothetical protein M011DRAFT_393556 [Sporormia fimetaria CBS 119925]
MSGELQTIPARHGVATFVPKGRTIKVINTYGKQVVSLWAFALGAPPEDEDEDESIDKEELEARAKELQAELEKEESEKEKTKDDDKDEKKDSSGNADEAKDSKEQPPEDMAKERDDQSAAEGKQPQKKTWSSYLPSIPYRSKGAPAKTEPTTKKSKKSQAEATKKWASYFPTGQSFSSYVPNVQLPDSKGVASAFKASHHRDPNKSYAEQLYEFSKTPVGAASLSAATGGGTASSLYAAYNAYIKMSPQQSDQPPMEYLSLPHSRVSLNRLVPEVDDTLLTNLRAPILTLIEDTTPGAHDTLSAACDASLYAALGVDNPEEHGSCAENLVLALKEINEKAGLKGAKAVGADITVYVAPTPLHLFMNTSIENASKAQEDGSGARGIRLKVDEPKAKKRSFVRFRAERDAVIVMSACPMDVGSQNGARPMAANFMVEDVSEEDMAASIGSLKERAASKKKPAKLSASSSPRPQSVPLPQSKSPTPDKSAKTKSAEKKEEPPSKKPGAVKSVEKKSETARRDTPKPKKKPKKLERRGTPAAKVSEGTAA